MRTVAHKIIRSGGLVAWWLGGLVAWWLGGWSRDIDKAMFVKADIVLGRHQELLSIQVETRRVILKTDLEEEWFECNLTNH